MPYSHFPNGFVNGVAIRQQIVANVYGQNSNVFWVDSVYGSNGNPGTISKPFATITFAVTQCADNNGDIIMVNEGHTEAVTTSLGLEINKIGISIIGVGTGKTRPQLTFSTDVGAAMYISEAKNYIYNLQFIAGIAGLLTCLNSDTTDITIDSCIFTKSSDAISAPANCILVANGAGANSTSNTTITNCEFYGNSVTGVFGTTSCIVLNGLASDNIRITNNKLTGNMAFGILVSNHAYTNLYILNNNISMTDTAGVGISLTNASTTGLIAYNNISTANTTTAAIVPRNCYTIENYVTNSVTGSASVYPVPSSSAQTSTGIGTQFWVTKAMTSSNILSASATDLTLVSTGDLAIREIILQTDATGLAGGTNVNILSNNATGQPIILAEAVANLGANKTVDITTASVTKQPAVLESGKKLQIQSTAAPCTGAGVVTVYIMCERLSAGSTLVAA